ncbi:MAG: MFS transporter [Eubacteriales bacterium]|nr:MFS transporter [Eubacteriales bacterium]
MKLNYRKTLCVGFAFFLICAFWQAYDTIIPKILTDKFGMSQTVSGAIMALDNVLALFMLPLFGALSDRCRSKLGRRTPFILIGTIAAAVAFVGLSFVDSMQLTRISEYSNVEDKATLEALYDYNYEKKTDSSGTTYELVTKSGEKFVLKEKFTREQFTSITLKVDKTDESGAVVTGKDGQPQKVTNPLYNDYVVPARQAVARDATLNNPAILVFFIGLLLVVLISMAVFRSPAVALMPDVTVKPLRSRANAVINLMGSFGGILVLVLGMVFKTGDVANDMMSYVVFFAIIAAIMISALVIFMVTVNEPRMVEEMHEESRRYGIEDEVDEKNVNAGDRKLSRGELMSLLLILASVVLWYMGYNAVTSKYSVYAGNVLAKDYNMTLIIAQAAAIISYLPVGIISSKLGRKKTILAGVMILAVAFGGAIFMRQDSPTLVMNILFALAGIGWATINVNSFPMVVELSRGGDVGKYTGFYYTASMLAQTVTPVLSGLFLDIRMTLLFPYATVFVLGSFVTMLFVRHGDSKPIPPENRLEALGDIDQ